MVVGRDGEGGLAPAPHPSPSSRPKAKSDERRGHVSHPQGTNTALDTPHRSHNHCRASCTRPRTEPLNDQRPKPAKRSPSKPAWLKALGLTWADIDHENDLIRVHRQLSRKRPYAPLKTEAVRREVILAPTIAKLLRERWLAIPFQGPAPPGLLQHDRPSARLPRRRRRRPHHPHAQRHHRPRPALAALAPPRLRLAAHLEWPEHRLCQPPTRPRQPQHHPRRLRPHLRTRRPRRHRQRRARSKLRRHARRRQIARRPAWKRCGNRRPRGGTTRGPLRAPDLLPTDLVRLYEAQSTNAVFEPWAPSKCAVHEVGFVPVVTGVPVEVEGKLPLIACCELFPPPPMA